MIIPDVVFIQLSFWGWAQGCLKHVEDSNKRIIEETVRAVGYLPEQWQKYHFTPDSSRCFSWDTQWGFGIDKERKIIPAIVLRCGAISDHLWQCCPALGKTTHGILENYGNCRRETKPGRVKEELVCSQVYGCMCSLAVAPDYIQVTETMDACWRETPPCCVKLAKGSSGQSDWLWHQDMLVRQTLKWGERTLNPDELKI